MLSGLFRVGKPFSLENTFLIPWRAETTVLLAYLLDVDSSPSKHIHKLRVLPALLIPMAQAEISVVSPRVYFSWVCKEGENTITGTPRAAFSAFKSKYNRIEEVSESLLNRMSHHDAQN